jgi:EAL domain-containing protein (putative c-di-GMP-specific phosphodiesterase class I)
VVQAVIGLGASLGTTTVAEIVDRDAHPEAAQPVQHRDVGGALLQHHLLGDLELGEWVLARACREAAGWPRPVRVAVNLSPVQFRAPDRSPRRPG